MQSAEDADASTKSNVVLGPASVYWRALILVATIGQLAVGLLLQRMPLPVPRWLAVRTNVRRVLESRGLTYIKVGQFLATRFDLFPAEVCRDLEKLFEQVAPVRFSAVQLMIETELGGSIHQFFETFNEQPIAAASVAQVYDARLKSGERVAVKVQRPGAAQTFMADMLLFRFVATFLDWFKIGGAISALEAVEQFWAFTARELDFIQEGRTADRLRGYATPNEIIPKIFWQWTTSKVLTMEYIDGISLARLHAAKEGLSGESVDALLTENVLRQAMRNLAQASLNQIFGRGFFHGDPHLGNLLVLADGSVAFVDFGIFGELTDRDRTLMRCHLEHLAVGNITKSFRYYAALQRMTDDSDPIQFARDTQRVMRRWYALSVDPATPVHERLAGRLSAEMLNALRENNVKVDMSLILFWRVFLVLDSTALRFASNLDLVSELRRYFEKTAPSADQRLNEFLASIDRADDLVRLASRVPENRGVARLGEIRSNVGLLTEESSLLKREKNREARLLTLSLVAVSLLIALAGARSSYAAMGGAFLAILLLIMSQRLWRDA